MSLYQAVVHLSVPRKGDPGKETDLVMAGETVELDDETAALFLPPRRVPACIRVAKESGDPMPQILPRMLSGNRINPRTGMPVGPPSPPADARPDPPGSSAVQVIPEAHEPQADSETRPAGDDAVDLPPRRARAAAASRG